MTNDSREASGRASDPGAVRLGTFSYLPPFEPDDLARQIDYLVGRDLEPAIEHVEPERARARYWYLWKLPLFGERSREAVEAELDACRAQYPDHHVRLIGYDTKRQTAAVSFVVHRGAA